MLKLVSSLDDNSDPFLVAASRQSLVPSTSSLRASNMSFFADEPSSSHSQENPTEKLKFTTTANDSRLNQIQA